MIAESKTTKNLLEEVDGLRRRLAKLEGELRESRLAEARLRQMAKSATDLVERNRTEDALVHNSDDLERSQERSQERTSLLEAVFANMSEGLVVADKTGKFLHFNPAASQILGLGAKDVDPSHWTEVYGVFLPDQVTPCVPEDLPLARAIRGEYVGNTELFVRHAALPAGSWIQVYGRPLWDENGAIRGGVVFIRDTTESKRAQELNSRLAALVESSDDMIVGESLDGTITTWNRGATKILGYEAEEVVGRPLTILLPPGRSDELPSLMETIRRGDSVEHFETVRRHKDGREIAVSLTISPIRNSAGVVIGASKIAKDITERNRARAEIRIAEEKVRELNIGLERRIAERTAELESAYREIEASRAELNSLFESLPGLYLVLTPDLKIVTVSDAYLNATMTTREGICGRGIFEVFPDNPEDLAATGVSNLRVSLDRVLQHRVPDTMAIQKYDIRRPDGVFEVHYWSPINSPVLGSDRQVKYIVHRVEDVTEFVCQKSATLNNTAELSARVQQMEADVFLSSQKLQTANQQLEVANKELEAFTYSVSHDLRAPLRAIDGFSRIVLKDFASEMSPEHREYVQDIRANTQKMGHLVDDLLTFSRLSRQPAKKERVAPATLVRQCLEELKAEKTGRRLEIEISELPECTGDASLLKQVWFNLIANALKYTSKRDRATIAIGSCRDNDNDNDEQIYFIKDNGVGFDMRYAGKLFGVFQRLHRADDYEGTGVGLAIVQRIIHRHGGRIWADAQPDRGASFFFTVGRGGSIDA